MVLTKPMALNWDRKVRLWNCVSSSVLMVIHRKPAMEGSMAEEGGSASRCQARRWLQWPLVLIRV